jgi:hypothetical protein
MPRGEHPNSRAALIPFQRKKGDPPLDKTGRNQWSAQRERARDRLGKDLDVPIECARRGDIAIFRRGLSPALDIKAHQLLDSEGTSVFFADLALRPACGTGRFHSWASSPRRGSQHESRCNRRGALAHLVLRRSPSPSP